MQSLDERVCQLIIGSWVPCRHALADPKGGDCREGPVHLREQEVRQPNRASKLRGELQVYA